MEANLYKNFHEMRKFIKSADPVGIQGTRVKTFAEPRFEQIKASRKIDYNKKRDTSN